MNARLRPDEFSHGDAVGDYLNAWVRDPIKVAEQLVEFEENGDSLAEDMASVLTCHPDDFEMLAVRFFHDQRKKLESAMHDKAAQQVDADEAEAEDRGCDDERWAA